MSVVENESFQSLLQLAVALNVGFAAIATFMGNTLSKEKEKVELLFETSKAIRDMTKEAGSPLSTRDRAGFREVTELRNNVTEAEAKYDGMFNGSARTIALVCALLSFTFLVIASIFGSSNNTIVAWIAICVNLPLLCLIGYASYIAKSVINPLRDRRHSLDERMSRKLVVLTRES